jgi:Rod binding domain-containing protein
MDALALQMATAGQGAFAPKLPAAGANDIDATAQDFEAVFISQMFEQLFEGVPTDGPMGGGTGERIFRSLMIQEVGRQVANQGGMGLAAAVKRELLALQEHGAK